MKIKTITCHCPLNFGAVLQAYALQAHLEESNNEVEIIDYRPDYLTIHSQLTYVGNSQYKSSFLLRLVYILRFLPSRLRSVNNFKRFEKDYFHLTPKTYYTFEDLINNPPPADLYICGSDQIWNPNLPNGTDESYYLSFVEDNKKKASYAASISITSISECYQKFIADRVRNFKAISVREDSAKGILSAIIPNEIIQVLDPVFLLSSQQWNILAEKSRIKSEKKYLLLYIMGEESQQILERANRIAKKENLLVYLITASLRNFTGVSRYFRGASPLDFLNLIINAQYVITNSFHGVAFSIIFNKQFIPCHIKDTNTRIRSLLSVGNITSAYCDDKDVSLEFQKIEYESVNKRLAQAIELSKSYILSVLK